jgi:hypothetical protein
LGVLRKKPIAHNITNNITYFTPGCGYRLVTTVEAFGFGSAGIPSIKQKTRFAENRVSMATTSVIWLGR